VVFILLLAWHSLYLLFVAALISLVRNSFKLPAGFGLSYKTGLYAMTYTYAAMLVMLLINVATPLSFTGFPFMVTLITLAGVGLNLKHLKD
jgi:flagellar biosynthesis component FlhA